MRRSYGSAQKGWTFGAVYLEIKCYHRQWGTAGKKEEREK